MIVYFEKGARVPKSHRQNAIIANNEHSDCGCESHFLINENGKGVKLFKTKREATFSRDRQIKANKWDIGPAVNSNIFKYYAKDSYEFDDGFEITKRKVLYGYETEIADEDLTNDIFLCQEDRLQDIFCHLFGTYYYDDHRDNFGVIDGRLVIVDFGEMSS